MGTWLERKTPHKQAQEDGKDPAVWNDVKEYLKSAGATSDKSKETQEYVDKVLKYEAEFSKKSKADKAVKSGKPRKVRTLQLGRITYIEIKL